MEEGRGGESGREGSAAMEEAIFEEMAKAILEAILNRAKPRLAPGKLLLHAPERNLGDRRVRVKSSTT